MVFWYKKHGTPYLRLSRLSRSLQTAVIHLRQRPWLSFVVVGGRTVFVVVAKKITLH